MSDEVTRGEYERRHNELSEQLLAIKAVNASEHKEIIGKLDSIDDRLFVDNGKPCIQSFLVAISARLDEHDRTFQKIGWFVAAVITVLIGGAIYGLAQAVIHAFGGKTG